MRNTRTKDGYKILNTRTWSSENRKLIPHSSAKRQRCSTVDNFNRIFNRCPSNVLIIFLHYFWLLRFKLFVALQQDTKLQLLRLRLHVPTHNKSCAMSCRHRVYITSIELISMVADKQLKNNPDKREIIWFFFHFNVLFVFNSRK